MEIQSWNPVQYNAIPVLRILPGAKLRDFSRHVMPQSSVESDGLDMEPAGGHVLGAAAPHRQVIPPVYLYMASPVLYLDFDRVPALVSPIPSS